MKEFCECGKLALWCYMPLDGIYYCDDCVPRGCDCHEFLTEYFENDRRVVYYPPKKGEGITWEWVKKDFIWRELREGKAVPCIEYFFDAKGWDIDEGK